MTKDKHDFAKKRCPLTTFTCGYSHDDEDEGNHIYSFTTQDVTEIREALRQAIEREDAIDHKTILLNLIAGASLADHMGDMAGDLFKALKLMGVDVPDCVTNVDQLGAYLGKEYGATTLYGTDLYNEEDYDEGFNYVG